MALLACGDPAGSTLERAEESPTEQGPPESTAPEESADQDSPDCAGLAAQAQAELAALNLDQGACTTDADCIIRQAPPCCCLGPVVIPKTSEAAWDRAATPSCEFYCDDACICAADFLPVRAVCVGGGCEAAAP